MTTGVFWELDSDGSRVARRHCSFIPDGGVLQISQLANSMPEEVAGDLVNAAEKDDITGASVLPDPRRFTVSLYDEPLYFETDSPATALAWCSLLGGRAPETGTSNAVTATKKVWRGGRELLCAPLAPRPAALPIATPALFCAHCRTSGIRSR